MTYSKVVGVTMTAVALALGAGCASKPTSRSTSEFGSDAMLTTRVKTAIATDSGLGNAVNIDVNTYRGVVQLSGFVDSPDKIQRAVNAARNVEGVHDVTNSLQVKPSS